MEFIEDGAVTDAKRDSIHQNSLLFHLLPMGKQSCAFTTDLLLVSVIQNDFSTLPANSLLAIGDVFGDGSDEYVVYGGGSGTEVRVLMIKVCCNIVLTHMPPAQ